MSTHKTSGRIRRVTRPTTPNPASLPHKKGMTNKTVPGFQGKPHEQQHERRRHQVSGTEHVNRIRKVRDPVHQRHRFSGGETSHTSLTGSYDHIHRRHRVSATETRQVNQTGSQVHVHQHNTNFLLQKRDKRIWQGYSI
jgi:hypothetical protein